MLTYALDACSSEPCQNGALCDLPQDEPEEGEFYCICTNGFEGELCEIEVITPPTPTGRIILWYQFLNFCSIKLSTVSLKLS